MLLAAGLVHAALRVHLALLAAPITLVLLLARAVWRRAREPGGEAHLRHRRGTRHGSLKADLHHWSAHSLGVFLAGKDWAPGEELPRYLDALGTLEEVISTRTFHPFFVRWLLPDQRTRADAAYRYLFAFFSDRLARRERTARETTGDPAGGPDDVLGHLARLQDRWSHEERVEEMISLVAGGTDAMSSVVAQALVFLSEHPAIQTEARAQLAAQPAGAAPPPLLLHVLDETVRLHPPVPFSSKVAPAGGVVELGHAIPPGTNILWMKTAVGRDPEQFDPARFARDGASMTQALPFGAGPRHCIGRALAESTCASLLAAILRSFDIAPEPGVPVTFTATVAVTPSAVPVRLVPRTAAQPQPGASLEPLVPVPVPAPPPVIHPIPLAARTAARCPFHALLRLADAESAPAS